MTSVTGCDKEVMEIKDSSLTSLNSLNTLISPTALPLYPRLLTTNVFSLPARVAAPVFPLVSLLGL